MASILNVYKKPSIKNFLIALGFDIIAGILAFILLVLLSYVFGFPPEASGALSANLTALLIILTFGYFVFYRAYHGFKNIDFKKYKKK